MRPVLAVLLLSSCAPRRVLELENRVLQRDNVELQRRLLDLEGSTRDPDDFAVEPSLETAHRFLERGGWPHPWAPGARHIRFTWIGTNATFDVTVQYFEAASVMFVATGNYLKLSDAQDTSSVVLLMIQIAALNYELLLGKFQLNPETGEILLSTELHVGDGLGYETFVSVVKHLIDTADARYPELERAAAGVGL